MPRSDTKLTKRTVDAAGPTGRRHEIWDSQTPGFGLRITIAGTKTFILRYRPKGRSASKRYMTLGRHGIITVEQARDLAKRNLGNVATGKDPALEEATKRLSKNLADVAADFLSEHVALKRKPKTLASYTHVLQHHVIPKLGRRQLSEVTRTDVGKLHASLAKTPYMANYVAVVLSSLFGWAERHGHCPEGFNPARRVEKFRESRRERFLSTEEFARLGAALREAETVGIAYEVDESRPTAKHAAKKENRRVVVAPEAIAAIRMLILTGCRLREILHLRWDEVDFQRRLLLLADSKTGRKTVMLNAAAVAILAGRSRVGIYVFAGSNPAYPRRDLKRPWELVKRRANLKELRIHDLRHTFASVAAGAGLGLPIIGKLLGHTQASTTARYAHLADDPLRRASAVIAEQIVAALEGAPPLMIGGDGGMNEVEGASCNP